jgi:hypothetical protein
MSLERKSSVEDLRIQQDVKQQSSSTKKRVPKELRVLVLKKNYKRALIEAKNIRVKPEQTIVNNNYLSPTISSSPVKLQRSQSSLELREKVSRNLFACNKENSQVSSPNVYISPKLMEIQMKMKEKWENLVKLENEIQSGRQKIEKKSISKSSTRSSKITSRDVRINSKSDLLDIWFQRRK